MKGRNNNWSGRILPRYCLRKHVIEGQIERKHEKRRMKKYAATG